MWCKSLALLALSSLTLTLALPSHTTDIDEVVLYPQDFMGHFQPHLQFRDTVDDQSHQAMLSSRQTNRNAITRRAKAASEKQQQQQQQRGNLPQRRQVPSGGTSVCLADTTISTFGVRGAVISNVQSSGVAYTELVRESGTNVAQCARLCAATATCNFALLFNGQCVANRFTNYGILSSAAFQDSFFFQGMDCARVKATVAGASSLSCCNLYYI